MKMQEMLLNGIEEGYKKENRFLDQQTDLKGTYKNLDEKIEGIENLEAVLNNTNKKIERIFEKQESVLHQNKKQFDFALNALILIIIVLVINIIFEIIFIADENWEMATSILLSMLLILGSIFFMFKNLKK